jgi:hypothetical protein
MDNQIYHSRARKENGRAGATRTAKHLDRFGIVLMARSLTESSACTVTLISSAYPAMASSTAGSASASESEKDQTTADAKSDGFGAACGSELAEDRCDVKFDGVVGNAQPRGDFLVAEACCQHPKNLPFTAR